MHRNKIYKLAVIALFALQAKGQDAHFSQYAELSSIINPALGGVTHDTRVTAGYRTQWGTVAKAYQTYGVAFEQSFRYKKLKGTYLGIVGNIFRDVAGDARLSDINPNLGLCGGVRMNRSTRLSGGIQGGFHYRTMDISTLKWDAQFNGYEFDAARPTGEEGNIPRSAISSYDVGAGINFNYAQSEKFISARDGNKANVGAAIYHFELPANSFFQSEEKLYTRFCVYANGDITIPRTKNAIMPSAIYTRQGPNTEILVGAMFKWILSDQSVHTTIRKPSAFSVGGQYRFKDAIVPSVLWQYDKYAIGISYDINVSALTPASKRQGGLEIMLRYNTSPGYGKNLGRADTRASY